VDPMKKINHELQWHVLVLILSIHFIALPGFWLLSISFIRTCGIFLHSSLNIGAYNNECSFAWWHPVGACLLFMETGYHVTYLQRPLRTWHVLPSVFISL
jgi:hypothetical protein